MIRPLFCPPASGGTAFSLRRPGNRLLVKRERDGGVLIRATADNLTAAPREVLVRYLDAEGCVPGVFAPPGGFHERI